MQWKAHHKHICEPYRHFTASQGYQRLAPHERLDAVLLSHLMAEHYLSNGTLKRQDAMLSMFLSLIEGPIRNEAPPTCPNSKTLVRKDVVNRLYARFGNNNFAIHSHLTCFAHGIFPLASRLFNHSCVPNAAAKYIIKPFQSISMEVVALTSISQNEEVWFDSHSYHSALETWRVSSRYVCRIWIRLCCNPDGTYWSLLTGFAVPALPVPFFKT